MIGWRRRKRQILNKLAQSLDLGADDDLVRDVLKFARKKGIAISRTEAEFLVREAFRLRVAQEIKKTRDQSIARDQALNEKIDGFHPP